MASDKLRPYVGCDLASRHLPPLTITNDCKTRKNIYVNLNGAKISARRSGPTALQVEKA